MKSDEDMPSLLCRSHEDDLPSITSDHNHAWVTYMKICQEDTRAGEFVVS